MHFFEGLRDAPDGSAARTYLWIQNAGFYLCFKGYWTFLSGSYLRLTILKLKKVPRSLYSALNSTLCIYSESLSPLPASCFPDVRSEPAVWTVCLQSKRESVGFVLALEETCTLSAVFLNRSVLFLTSGRFNIPRALTNTDA